MAPINIFNTNRTGITSYDKNPTDQRREMRYLLLCTFNFNDNQLYHWWNLISLYLSICLKQHSNIKQLLCWICSSVLYVVPRSRSRTGLQYEIYFFNNTCITLRLVEFVLCLIQVTKNVYLCFVIKNFFESFRGNSWLNINNKILTVISRY